MSFVMPSKYGSSLPFPKDPSVAIKEVPSKIVAVAAFLDLNLTQDLRLGLENLDSALQVAWAVLKKKGKDLVLRYFVGSMWNPLNVWILWDPPMTWQVTHQ
ncbi:hypothetical protein DCAR_0519977 [Daucus carota subsp. sativus]|uniref:Uncharacterized protein n=1 Tax=Daucus carota subsp. sativus TaxID=79200 RepID=A0AAF0X5C9_DAUCS|nr:hypothetical protein DCAR_0519977 [Daucus carota subsp. sativus]